MQRKNMFKVIVAIAVTLVFVAPVGACAFVNNEKTMDNKLNDSTNTENLGFTYCFC